MKIVQHGKKRKAISPVLATVILIAITLIAAIAVAGFVFGLFGSFTSSALISVSSASIAHGVAATPFVGSVVAQNTGTSNAQVTAVTVTYGGQTCSPAITGGPQTVTAGAAPGITVTLTSGTCGAASTSGESFSGSFSLSNGGQAAFSGQVQ